METLNQNALKQGRTVESRVFSRIVGKGRGCVFSAKTFADLSNRRNIDWALGQLLTKGKIRRLARGLYDYPKQSQLVGLIPASPLEIARAITSKQGAEIQPAGAYAANILGLSEQIPARLEFLTDAEERTVQIDNREIILRRTTPRIMQMAGKMSGLITQALRFIGKENVTLEQLEQLRQKLSPQDKKQLIKDIALPPAWIADCFRKITQ